MKRLFIILLALSLSMVSCTSNKKKNMDDSEALENADDEIVLVEDDDEFEEEEMDDDVASVDTADDSDIDLEAEDGDSEVASSDVPSYGEGMGEYITQRNDTLMIIAWKMYGDYTKWRDILEWNSDKISNVSSISVGMKLQYKYPDSKFEWSPNGDAYLILRGDTLGGISRKVYQSERYWKDLYDNNKPLIRDPNLIFAGFTIYYDEIDRNTASEKI
jgi:nucleoid-associated protein YgaU